MELIIDDNNNDIICSQIININKINFDKNYIYNSLNYYNHIDFDNNNFTRKYAIYEELSLFERENFDMWLNDYINMNTNYEYPDIIHNDTVDGNDLHILYIEQFNYYLNKQENIYLGVFNNLHLAQKYKTKIDKLNDIDKKKFLYQLSPYTFIDSDNYNKMISNTIKLSSLNEIALSSYDYNNNKVKHIYEVQNGFIGFIGLSLKKSKISQYNNIHEFNYLTNIPIYIHDIINYNYSLEKCFDNHKKYLRSYKIDEKHLTNDIMKNNYKLYSYNIDNNNNNNINNINNFIISKNENNNEINTSFKNIYYYINFIPFNRIFLKK